MVVALLVVDLLLHASGSLKDKRRVLVAVTERLKARFNISVAETAFQNDYKRAQLAVVCVGSAVKVVDGVLDGVVRHIDAHCEAEITARTIDYLC